MKGDEDIVALRCYIEHKQDYEPVNKANDGWNHLDKSDRSLRDAANDSMVLVLDAETTADQYQNLLFGSCGIWINGCRWKFFLFHADDLPKDKVDIIKGQAAKINATVMSRTDFVERVFFQYAYHVRAKIIGFNLKFDLSTLAISYGEARKPKFHNGFSLKLSPYPVRPRVWIRTLNSKAAFTEFAPPLKSKKSERKLFRHFRGCFIDLRTVTFALTNKSHTLESALKAFGCQMRKLSTEEHGKLTPEYVKYNVNDTLSTHELFEKVVEWYSHYNLKKGLNQLYSPASIGKAYLDEMGVTPFLDKNSKFPPQLLGYVMTSYYGGRTETRIRKQATKVCYLDFASMYPSVYVLLDIDAFLKAEKITYNDTTKQTKEFVASITLDNIVEKKIWSCLHTLCKVRPEDDIFPFRSLYGDKNAYNIGLNYVTATDGSSAWYTLADVIASKLLTGKTPKIIRAITFCPQGRQRGLRAINIVGGIVVRPEDDFIQKLIVERLRMKKDSKSLASQKRSQADQLQTDLKIIANSSSYGIYIEMNTEEGNDHVLVHGINPFDANVNRIETQGRAFNPIMGTFIPAGARLILAAVEAVMVKNCGHFVYCDTDGVFISPQHATLVQDFFRPLNPFGIGGDVFKIEEDDHDRPLDDVWLYAISSKRYVLYDRDEKTGQIKIRKYSSHGLGHMQGINEELWWQDILQLHYHPEYKAKVLDKYKERFAVARLTVNDYRTFSRFKNYNKNQPLKKQLKPFSFMTVGVGCQIDEETGKPVIPTVPYIAPNSMQFQDVPYMPFFNYKTGRRYSENTEFYWQPLSDTFEQFVNHSESKFDGDIGELCRKCVRFSAQSIHYIGKETNELEESEVIGADLDNYTEYAQQLDNIGGWKECILNALPRDVRPYGITANHLWYIKRTVHKGEFRKLKSKTISQLIEFIRVKHWQH